MTKQTLRCCGVLALMCFTAACTTPRVTTDSNPRFSMATCHTYNWAGSFLSDRGSGPTFANRLNEDRFRSRGDFSELSRLALRCQGLGDLQPNALLRISTAGTQS